MKIVRKECTHCGTPYSFVASGHIENPELNDENYCPDCSSVIIKALEKVPKRFEYRHIEVTNVSVEELLAAEKELPQQVGGFGNVRRCFPELYDSNLEAWTKTRQIPYNRNVYILCEYPNGTHTIKKKVLWDIKNNKEH